MKPHLNAPQFVPTATTSALVCKIPVSSSALSLARSDTSPKNSPIVAILRSVTSEKAIPKSVSPPRTTTIYRGSTLYVLKSRDVGLWVLWRICVHPLMRHGTLGEAVRWVLQFKVSWLYAVKIRVWDFNIMPFIMQSVWDFSGSWLERLLAQFASFFIWIKWEF